MEFFFHLEEPLGFLSRDASDRDASPHRHNLSDIFLGHPCLVTGRSVLQILLLRIDPVSEFPLPISQFGRQLELLARNRRFKLALQARQTSFCFLQAWWRG